MIIPEHAAPPLRFGCIPQNLFILFSFGFGFFGDF